MKALQRLTPHLPPFCVTSILTSICCGVMGTFINACALLNVFCFLLLLLKGFELAQRPHWIVGTGRPAKLLVPALACACAVGWLAFLIEWRTDRALLFATAFYTSMALWGIGAEVRRQPRDARQL